MVVIDQVMDTFILEDDLYPTPIIIEATYYPGEPGKPIKFSMYGVEDWGEPSRHSYVDIDQIIIKTREGEIVCNNDLIYDSINEDEVCRTIEKWLKECSYEAKLG